MYTNYLNPAFGEYFNPSVMSTCAIATHPFPPQVLQNILGYPLSRLTARKHLSYWSVINQPEEVNKFQMGLEKKLACSDRD